MWAKGMLYFLCLFIFSCTSPCNRWCIDETKASHPRYCSTRLTFPCKDPCYGMKLEILHTQENYWAYLNTYTFTFTSNIQPLTITIADQSVTYNAFTLEGDQRLLLPQEATTFLIQALLSNHTVHLSAGMLEATVEPTLFKKCFEKLRVKTLHL